MNLDDITRRARLTQSVAFAKGTKANYRSHVLSYLSFCIYFNLLPFPLNCTNFIPFLQLFSDSVTSYGYVYNVLSSVKSIASLLGHSLDIVTIMNISVFMSGLKRSMLTPVTPRLPINPYMLNKIAHVVNFQDTFELCVWTAILFMFFSFFRKSNVLPMSCNSFDPSKQLSRASIAVSDNCSFMLVRVSWSKTIQYKQRSLYIPICCIPGSILCPVKSYIRLCKIVKAPYSSPAFVYIRNGVRVTLNYSQFVNQLQKWLGIIGVQSPKLYCSHSLRREGATWAFQSGVSPELIKLQGDWQSDCYRRYIQMDLVTKLSTTSTMSDRIVSLGL